MKITSKGRSFVVAWLSARGKQLLVVTGADRLCGECEFGCTRVVDKYLGGRKGEQIALRCVD